MTQDSHQPSDPTCPDCGATLPSADAPCPRCTVPLSAGDLASLGSSDQDGELARIRSVLGDEYEIVEELGRGGMAIVYRAREEALARDVAIKVLPFARTFDEEIVRRFQREARLAAGLDHPNVIPIHRVGQSGRVNFIVMKYVDGPSLAELLEAEGRIDPDEVARILIQVSDALEHAHGRGLVHRDIKPDNIMRDPSGRYLVMDFGIARPFGGGQLTRTGDSLGTPKYMSPEQARAGDLDGRSDFYSLGVVGYHCLVGEPPFEGDDAFAVLYSHLHDPVPEPELASPKGRRVLDVVRRLMRKDPEARLQSAGSVKNALRGESTSPGETANVGTPSGEMAEASGGRSGGERNGGGERGSEAGRGRRVRSGAGTGSDGGTGAGDDSEADGGRASGSPVPWRAAAGAADRIRSWAADRPRRFWITTAVVAVLLGVVFIQDGAAGRCRAAMPEADADDREVLVEPIGTVASGAPIEIEYLICGVPDGEPLSVQLTFRAAGDGGIVGGVRRLLGGGEDPLRISWDDVSDGFATEGTHLVTPGDLEPASYQAILRVREAEGRETEGSRDFLVVDQDSI